MYLHLHYIYWLVPTLTSHLLTDFYAALQLCINISFNTTFYAIPVDIPLSVRHLTHCLFSSHPCQSHFRQLLGSRIPSFDVTTTCKIVTIFIWAPSSLSSLERYAFVMSRCFEVSSATKQTLHLRNVLVVFYESSSLMSWEEEPMRWFPFRHHIELWHAIFFSTGERSRECEWCEGRVAAPLYLMVRTPSNQFTRWPRRTRRATEDR